MPFTVIAISGSLRKQSKTTAVVNAAVNMSSDLDINVVNYDISHIPLYNEDLEMPGTDTPFPDSVISLRNAVKGADALLLATPENNFLTSAAMKNVLDWLSRGEKESPLSGKTVGVISTGAYGGASAQETLRGSLAKMHRLGMNVIAEPQLKIKLFDGVKRFDDQNNLVDQPTLDDLKSVLESLRGSTN